MYKIIVIATCLVFNLFSLVVWASPADKERIAAENTINSYQARSEKMNDLPLLKRTSRRLVTLHQDKTSVTFEFVNIARGEFKLNSHLIVFREGGDVIELERKILAALPKKHFGIKFSFITEAYADDTRSLTQRLKDGANYLIRTAADFNAHQNYMERIKALSDKECQEQVKGLDKLTRQSAQKPYYLTNRCFTSQFWCFMKKNEFDGTSCYCGTPYGPICGMALAFDLRTNEIEFPRLGNEKRSNAVK